MLLNLLRNIFNNHQSGQTVQPSAIYQYPNEIWHQTASAHAGAPMEQHLEIALGDLRIGEHDLRALNEICLTGSSSKVSPLKALHRPLAAYFLSRYFTYAMTLEGQYAECGVCRGTSALLLCHAAKARRPNYVGEGLHLIDSFEGINQPVDEDHFDARNKDGSLTRSAVPKGSLSAPLEVVTQAIRDFPKVAVWQGWIPTVFQQLPDTKWAFVHIDVDLYEPTRDCLEYFFPRLSKGGVIVCDDYAALMFPGARRAWDEYCAQHSLPFVVLDTGQSVILNV